MPAGRSGQSHWALSHLCRTCLIGPGSGCASAWATPHCVRNGPCSCAADSRSRRRRCLTLARPPPAPSLPPQTRPANMGNMCCTCVGEWGRLWRSRQGSCRTRRRVSHAVVPSPANECCRALCRLPPLLQTSRASRWWSSLASSAGSPTPASTGEAESQAVWRRSGLQGSILQCWRARTDALRACLMP